MTWFKWLPWRFLLRHVARRQGFLDPIALLARLHSFAQPSEVAEPIELLRAGVVFHARGLINSRVVQHNLDWVWPYWIERQFDPRDPSFIPRAFSITHVNLSHRNWTAVGYPDCDGLPIIDPRGLLTPFYDGWSLDAWLVMHDGRVLLPSRAVDCCQRQHMDKGLRVTTTTKDDGLALTTTAWVEPEAGVPVCKLQLEARSDAGGWLVLALRPYNPEGISFIQKVRLSTARDTWIVDDEKRIELSQPAMRHYASDYRDGDVYIHLRDLEDRLEQSCEVGMVTAATLFPLRAGEPESLTATIPLGERETPVADAWLQTGRDRCQFDCPEPQYRFLFEAALHSLILHSPGDVYPGPYTYKRFWFRDAAFIIHALLCVGLNERAERALARFPERQTALGYFRSQEGEWDANGQVLWILQRFFALTGRSPSADWLDPVSKGAHWILRKRLGDDPDAVHAGLLPAGFSAEHLGPNDYYYWDDFWSMAGLHAAAALCKDLDPGLADEFGRGAADFMGSIERSIASCAGRLARQAMPASPYRRLDAGAIGSLAVGYPLQLFAPDDPRLLDSVEFLLDRCFVKGAFYQDMVHSGLNAYLTLHVAQVLLRAGDPRSLELVDTVAALASPTGQWPEAIHPLTGGGCMGDGHHVWAAAEWVLMIRNCFVREEGEQLVLCAGVPGRWLDQSVPIRFGPAPTAFGDVTVTVTPDAVRGPRVSWRGDWHRDAPLIQVRLPGFDPVSVDARSTSAALSAKGGCL